MKYICSFLLRLLGWKAMEPAVPENKCIILGVPHTSMFDFLISYLYYRSQGKKAYVMIKKELFFFPLGSILRAMGGIAVDRKRGASLTRQLISEFDKKESLHLAIAPEGTRQATDKWKTGFHTIAKSCGVPVYLGYFDWGKKEIGRGVKFELTDSASADLKKIREWYRNKGVVGKYPEQFSTGSDLD